jgi:hypothetical protein
VAQAGRLEVVPTSALPPKQTFEMSRWDVSKVPTADILAQLKKPRWSTPNVPAQFWKILHEPLAAFGRWLRIRRAVISHDLAFQQSHMTHLQGLGLAHDFEQFPRFVPCSALTFQFRYSSLLRADALLPCSDKSLGAWKHFVNDCSRMRMHVRNTT